MAIDRVKAIEQLSQLKAKGNNDGLIPEFGVLINFLPTNFWNSFTEFMIMNAKDKLKEVGAGLEKAAAECGYHTGYGIITSKEFNAIIGPMVEKKPDDILHGAFAVLTAWGWADSEIVELIPNEKMVVRAYGYYESEIRDTFKVVEPCAYMLTGICRAFMDLGFSAAYPNGYGAFKSVQTKGIEVGNEYAEILITKK
jgi:hypothetical protein